MTPGVFCFLRPGGGALGLSLSRCFLFEGDISVPRDGTVGIEVLYFTNVF